MNTTEIKALNEKLRAASDAAYETRAAVSVELSLKEVSCLQSALSDSVELLAFFEARRAGRYPAQEFTPANFHDNPEDCIAEMQRIGRETMNA